MGNGGTRSREYKSATRQDPKDLKFDKANYNSYAKQVARIF
jgi:hypothetical protein